MLHRRVGGGTGNRILGSVLSLRGFGPVFSTQTRLLLCLSEPLLLWAQGIRSTSVIKECTHSCGEETTISINSYPNQTSLVLPKTGLAQW